MNISPTTLPPAVMIDLAPIVDERGFFARVFCADIFTKAGLPSQFPQSSLSFNRRRGTLRGLHYQAAPAQEGKLVRCTRGAIFDVVIDLRNQSDTFGRWEAFELTEANHRTIFVPPGFAHGFQTLTDDVEVLYHMTQPYQADLSFGLRWNDPTLAIPWPDANPTLSARDAALPGLEALRPA